jgi:hypothetical protein
MKSGTKRICLRSVHLPRCPNLMLAQLCWHGRAHGAIRFLDGCATGSREPSFPSIYRVERQSSLNVMAPKPECFVDTHSSWIGFVYNLSLLRSMECPGGGTGVFSCTFPSVHLASEYETGPSFCSVRRLKSTFSWTVEKLDKVGHFNTRDSYTLPTVGSPRG